LIDSVQQSGSDPRSISLALTLSITLLDLNLSIFPSIPCLVSGRRSVPIIIVILMIIMSSCHTYTSQKINRPDRGAVHVNIYA